MPSYKWFKWFLRPVRMVGVLVVMAMPSACAFCIETKVHPAAIEHNQYCAQYYQQGKLVEAESRCKLAREYSPKYAEPVNLLGLIEYARGRSDVAVQYFKEALSLKEDFAEAHNNLGAIFLLRREYGQACDQFKQAVEIDPGFVSARVNLGQCFLFDGENNKARAEFLKCLELDPHACGCHLGLGSLADASNDYEEAQTFFKKMTETCPDDPTGFYNLCTTYYKMGRCGEAIDACIGAIAIKRDHLEARKGLTEAYNCLAMEDAAVREYIEKIQRNPGDPDLHFNLAMVYYEKKLMDNALNEYLNTIKLNPQHLLGRYWAARIYDSQLKADETIQMCKQFIDLLRGENYGTQKEWCLSRVRELQFQ